MKTALYPYIVLLLASFFAGCNTPGPLTNAGRTGTAEEGVKAAEKDLERGFFIIRYDVPPMRTGVWTDYYKPFKELGIAEEYSFFHSLKYCEGYNRVMDRALTKRYGTRYLKLRDQLLPAPGAKIWTG